MIQLLDTNVVSELRKVHTGRADAGVAAWLARQSELDLYVSVITIYEIETGILRAERKDPSQAAILRRWLQEGVMGTFDQRILGIDANVALRCADLCTRRTCEFGDAFIAAIALEYRMTLVTRNAAHFEPLGVRVINPWLS